MSDAVNEIKAVIFDLGETLLNFGRIDVVEMFRRGARLSYDYLLSLNQPVKSFGWYYRKNYFAIRIRYVLSQITGKDFNSLELLKKVNRKAGRGLDRQQWEQLAWLWYRPLSEKAEVEPDIVRTLSMLRDMGLQLAILSNTFVPASTLDRHLQQCGILHFFPVRLYSYQFRWKKPRAALFLAAAGRIGRQVQNILFVGDRLRKDIRPALAVGMAAVLKAAYTNAGRDAPVSAARIETLAELPAFIKNLNGNKVPVRAQAVAGP